MTGQGADLTIHSAKPLIPERCRVKRLTVPTYLITVMCALTLPRRDNHRESPIDEIWSSQQKFDHDELLTPMTTGGVTKVP